MTWNILSLTELATAYWPASALCAAIELGVFEALGDAPLPAATVAERVQAAPRQTEALLDALTGLGLLVKSGTGYALEASARPYLDPKGAMCILGALRYNVQMYPLWGRLASAVRDGKPVIPPTAHLGGDAGRTRHFVMGMHTRALAMIPAVLPGLDIESPARVLDVGAGPGTFSVRLAETRPGLHITLSDLPPILEIARELVAQSPAAGCVDFAPADYRTDALPAGYDAVLYCGALHQEDTTSAAGLFAKIRRSLKPGGRLYVIDMMLDDTGTQPTFSTLFTLNMMLTSPMGRVFRAADVETWLAGQGFGAIARQPLTGSPYWLVKGRLNA